MINKWNQLLAALDAVFGMNGKEKSKFRKLSQDFDERTNEHVIVLKYRVKGVAGTMKSTPRKASGQRQMAFLRQLVAAQGKTQ